MTQPSPFCFPSVPQPCFGVEPTLTKSVGPASSSSSAHPLPLPTEMGNANPVSFYLIICPDIVNAIRLCWSLVAERKREKNLISGTGRLQDFGGEVLGEMEMRRRRSSERSKPSLFLNWEVCVYSIIYHDWGFCINSPSAQGEKIAVCFPKTLQRDKLRLSCSAACHCLSVPPVMFLVAIIKFILILHCQKPSAFFLVIRKHHLFAIPQELRIYTRLSSPVYANPQLHLNGIFRAFFFLKNKRNQREKQDRTCTEKQHLAQNKSIWWESWLCIYYLLSRLCKDIEACLWC